MEFARVDLTFEGQVATLRLNHPEVMNAVSIEMLDGLRDALDAVEAREPRVRCLVLTGTGKAFCTGANLQRFDQPEGGRKAEAGDALDTHFHPFLRRLRDLPFPIVSAVNGPAAGAGMSLALFGDLVLCARSAYFLQAFRRIGLVPDCGSTWLLPRLIGRARALELSLLGERLPADTALTWGLVNRVHDDADLMGAAMTLAHDLANGPTVSLTQIRRLYWSSPESTFEDQIARERASQRTAARSADFREGVGAFLAKRPALFTGK